MSAIGSVLAVLLAVAGPIALGWWILTRLKGRRRVLAMTLLGCYLVAIYAAAISLTLGAGGGPPRAPTVEAGER